MSNMITINQYSRMLNNFSNISVKGAVGEDSKDFSRNIMEKAKDIDVTSKSQSASKTEKHSQVNNNDMTLDEYKDYISNIISNYPMHPTKAKETYTINISDVGFEAMKNDPEYEKWVLDDLKTCFANPVPAWYQAMGGPSTYTIFHYGASKEEFKGERFPVSGSGSSNILSSHSENDFWSTRSGIQKKINKQEERKAAERKIQQKKIMEERIHHKEMMESLERKRLNAELIGRKVTQPINSVMATELYEATFLTEEQLQNTISF